MLCLFVALLQILSVNIDYSKKYYCKQNCVFKTFGFIKDKDDKCLVMVKTKIHHKNSLTIPNR